MRNYTCHNNKIISMTFDNTLYSKVPSKYQVISISISMLQQHYIQRRSSQFQALFIQRRPSSSAKRRRETSKSSNEILVGGVNKSSAQVAVKITNHQTEYPAFFHMFPPFTLLALKSSQVDESIFITIST